MVAGRRVFFLDAEVVRHRGKVTPGRLIRVGRTTTTLAAGKDALVVHWVQPEGEEKRPLSRLCVELGLKAGDVL